jgi:CheY-like chemotaxis protein
MPIARGAPAVSHTVQQAAGVAVMAAAPVAGLLASFDATIISSAIVAVGLALGGTMTYLWGVWLKNKAAADEAELKHREAEAAADRAERIANAEADRLIAAAEAAARLKLDADAHAARLKLDAAAHSARLAMELEREAKLGPTMSRQIEELKAQLNAKMDVAGRERHDIKAGQDTIKKALDQVTRYRVVIVDDDPAARKLLCDILSGHGYDCTPVGTLAEARALMPSRPDWDLVDIQLDGENGLDLLHEIKDRKDRCWVGMLTGHALESLPVADRNFADIALSKPLDAEKLVALMRSREHKAPRPTLDDVAEAATGSKVDFPAIKVERA